MSELAKVAVVVGSLITVCGLPGLIAPAEARAWVKAFPRNVVAGRVLTAVDVAWAAWLLYHAVFLAGTPWLRQLVVYLSPVVFLLLIFLMDELLAARALGGLLLLVPYLVLDAARWHESSWRLILTVLAYVWVVIGITLMLSPYRFRQAMDLLSRNSVCFRLAGAAAVAGGLCIVYLGVAVFS